MRKLKDNYIQTWLMFNELKIRTRNSGYTLDYDWIGTVLPDETNIDKHELVIVGYLVEDATLNEVYMTWAKAFYTKDFEEVKCTFGDGKEYYFLTSGCVVDNLNSITRRLHDPCKNCDSGCINCIHNY